MTNTDKITKEIMRDYAETFTALKEYDERKMDDINYRAEEITRAIRLAWSSLETHLVYTYKGRLIRDEDRDFHKQCVKEYSDIIKVLSQLY